MLGSECMSSASSVSALNNQARPSAPGCDHFLFVCMCGQVCIKVMYNLRLSCLSWLGLASDARLARQVSPRDPLASAFLSLGLET